MNNNFLIGFIVLTFFILTANQLFTQDLKEIFIDCDPEAFVNIYENYEENIYIPIIITFDGTSWSDVQLRLRGDSSREYPKKSLKAQFNSEPFFNGKYTINFNAEYHDLSYMHSVLSSRLFNDLEIPSPSMEHVRIYLNGSFLGLYIMTENMDQQFLETHNLDPNGILYKASRDGACLSLFDNPFYHWELNNGDDPYADDLTALIMGINDSTQDFLTFIQSQMNYNQVITFIALNMLLSNGSTYYHNYFLFKGGAFPKWSIFPWDLDRTFSDYGIWYPYHRSSGNWTPDNPLLERAIIHDDMFLGIMNKVEEIQHTIFNESYLYPQIDSLIEVISNSVEEDSTDNIPDYETWQNKINLDKEFIVDRNQQLNFQFHHHPKPFAVDRIMHYIEPGEDIQFTWQPSYNPDGSPVTYTFYFSTDPFFQHPETIIISDIQESFLSFSAPEKTGKYFWMIEATDGNHLVDGFDTYNKLFVCENIPGLIINEINYNSSPEFDPGDWVELHNPESEDVDISGWMLLDDNNEHVFTFPSGMMIESKGYIVVCRYLLQFSTLFPAISAATGDLGFGLSNGGELIRLLNPEGYLVDEVLYRDTEPWPQEPDGNGPTLELMNPSLNNELWYNWFASYGHGTPGSINSIYSPDFIEENTDDLKIEISVFPNPCNDYLVIFPKKLSSGSASITLADFQGRPLEKFLFPNQKKYTLKTGNLVSGIYFGSIKWPGGRLKTFKFVKE